MAQFDPVDGAAPLVHGFGFAHCLQGSAEAQGLVQRELEGAISGISILQKDIEIQYMAEKEAIV